MKTLFIEDDVLPNPHIFLCLAHRDKRFVRRLSRDLASLDIRVWLDEWELTVGDSLHGCIGRALEESAYIGVVLTPDSVNSRWCRDELEQALTREKRDGKKVVLPLLHRRVKPPPFLEGRVFLNFSRSYLRSLAALVGQLRGIAQRELSTAIHDTPPKTVESVQELIGQLSSDAGIVYIDAPQYRRIRDAFKTADIDISGDAFKIFTDRLHHSPVMLVDLALNMQTEDSENGRLIAAIKKKDDDDEEHNT